MQKGRSLKNHKKYYCIAKSLSSRWCVSVGGFDLREVAISEHESIFDVPAEFRRETTYI